eukprot:1164565-Rhodomonas_salina.2
MKHKIPLSWYTSATPNHPGTNSTEPAVCDMISQRNGPHRTAHQYQYRAVRSKRAADSVGT